MDTAIGILEWTNEHSNGSYPLTQPINPQDFIVDASFLQFDGFIPVLKSLSVRQGKATLVVLTDAGDISVVVDRPSSSFFPGTFVELRSATRYLGRLVFGQGLPALFSIYLDTTLRLNIPFVPSVVRGVPSNSGVYALAGYTGDVVVNTGESAEVRSLFFSTSGNQVTWNAGWLGNQVTQQALKTLNGVTPINNAVFIEDSDLIKVEPQSGGVSLSVIGSLSRDIVAPTVKYG